MRKAAGKIAGRYCANAERAVACAKRGIRFLVVGSDLGFLRAGTAAQVKTLRAPVAAAPQPGAALPKTATDAEIRMILGLTLLLASAILLLLRRRRLQLARSRER